MIRRASEMKAEVRDKMRGGAGAVTVRHYFAKEEFGAAVRFCACLVLPPGAGIGLHAHEGEDEIYIVVRGSGRLEENGVRGRISAGDSVLTGKGASHAVHNDGTEDLEIIAVIAEYAARRPA